ncbi:MAG: TIGR03643 family protein [Phormidesmis sp.]
MQPEMQPEQSDSKEPIPQQPTLEEFKVEEFDLRRREPDEAAEDSADGSNYESPDPTELDTATVDRVIEMAWEDRTPFGAIEEQFGLKEKDVIAVMRRYMKRSSFEMWRKRVTDRGTKHAAKRDFEVGRFKSSNQKNY